MIVVIDNYDSFTFNLVQAFGVLGADLRVFRNDRVDADEILQMVPEGVVLSPGPGRPEDAGCCIDVIRELGHRIPILGVCLGHQAIGAAFGATVGRAPEVVHGKTTSVAHDGGGLFVDLPQPLQAARYHSLIVRREELPAVLRVDATAPGDLIMAMSHREHPLYGVQFHPESIATPDGPGLLANFLRLARSRSRPRGGDAPC